MLKQERIIDLLDYKEETGDLIWKKRMSSRVPAGAKAGTITKDGYRATKIDGHWIYAHRVIWIYMYGSLPPEYIDHIDGNKDNNRLLNLRAVTNQENQHNQKITGRKTASGVLGVSFHKKANRWQAAIRIGGEMVYLGLFKTIDLASIAYKSAKKSMHPTAPLHQVEGV